MRHVHAVIAVVVMLTMSSMAMAGEYDLFGASPRPVAGSAPSFDLFCSAASEPIQQSECEAFCLFVTHQQQQQQIETVPSVPDVPDVVPSPEPEEHRQSRLTLHLPDGRIVDAQSYISQHYSRPWTYPGDIDSHLMRHGLREDEVRRLSVSDRRRLHAAIHEEGVIDEVQSVQLAAQEQRRSVQPVQAYQPCPGGICPQQGAGYYTQPSGTRRRPIIRWLMR